MARAPLSPRCVEGGQIGVKPPPTTQNRARDLKARGEPTENVLGAVPHLVQVHPVPLRRPTARHGLPPGAPTPTWATSTKAACTAPPPALRQVAKAASERGPAGFAPTPLVVLPSEAIAAARAPPAKTSGAMTGRPARGTPARAPIADSKRCEAATPANGSATPPPMARGASVRRTTGSARCPQTPP